MTPPTASTLAMAALVPLMAWRIVVRFRRASGRQRLSRFRGPITLAIYGLLIGAIALANARQPLQLAAFATALALGGALACYALRRAHFEASPEGLFFTPHGPIGITLAILFVARLAWRLVEVYALDASAVRSFGEFARSPLTLAAFGLMAGYYTVNMVGLMRWRRHVLRRRDERRSNPPGEPRP